MWISCTSRCSARPARWADRMSQTNLRPRPTCRLKSKACSDRVSGEGKTANQIHGYIKVRLLAGQAPLVATVAASVIQKKTWRTSMVRNPQYLFIYISGCNSTEDVTALLLAPTRFLGLALHRLSFIKPLDGRGLISPPPTCCSPPPRCCVYILSIYIISLHIWFVV